MKWLKDNPLGMVLAATSGVLVLLVLVMGIIWNLPAAVETAETDVPETAKGETVLVAHQVAAISEFQVINEKPVFNESRQPEIVEQVGAADSVEKPTIEIKDAPDVRLTGVVITPTLKIASLTPADKKIDNVMVHEGQPLTGEFVGWQLSSVNPRNVVLESLDGQMLKLELQVHDVKIKEPPKPVAQARKSQAKPGQPEQIVDEGGQPLSRAEQIRQRIAERRDELRREQEDKQSQQAQNNVRSSGTAKAAKPQDYSSAIRALMQKNRKEKSSNDKEDG